jgi:hypothetical protein
MDLEINGNIFSRKIKIALISTVTWLMGVGYFCQTNFSAQNEEDSTKLNGQDISMHAGISLAFVAKAKMR